jgi:hypothetical protein
MTKIPQAWAKSSHMHSKGGTLLPLKELIAGIDLPALIQQYAGPGKHSGGKWLYSCPNADHYDAHASFSVFTGRDGKWHAHCLSQCGHIGDALACMTWLHRCDNAEGIRRLREWAGQPATFNATPPAKSKSKQVAAMQAHDPGYTVLDEPTTMSAYLNSRAWPSDTVEHFGLKVVRLNRANEGQVVRVLHPFHEYRGGAWCETSWQARRLDNSPERRWLGPLGGSLPIYNLQALDPSDLRAVVICEGVSDTVTAWLAVRDIHGIGVIGVPGSQAWQRQWASYFAGLEVVIAGDNDKAGAAFTTTVANDLRSVAASLIDACPASDVNDLTDMAKVSGLDSVRHLLTNALTLKASPNALSTTPPSDPVALVLAQFKGSHIVCRVCNTPTPAAYCTNCAALTKSKHTKALKWAGCDICHEPSLGGNGKKCKRSQCGGTFRAYEVQP